MLNMIVISIMVGIIIVISYYIIKYLVRFLVYTLKGLVRNGVGIMAVILIGYAGFGVFTNMNPIAYIVLAIIALLMFKVQGVINIKYLSGYDFAKQLQEFHRDVQRNTPGYVDQETQSDNSNRVNTSQPTSTTSTTLSTPTPPPPPAIGLPGKPRIEICRACKITGSGIFWKCKSCGSWSCHSCASQITGFGATCPVCNNATLRPK